MLEKGKNKQRKKQTNKTYLLLKCIDRLQNITKIN